MTESIHLLVGPYVLDALDEAQTAQFEQHLEGCDDCRREVLELRETASLLGSAQAGPDVTKLKSTVMAQVSRTPQLPPLIRPHTARRRIGRSLGWIAAAAATVVVVVLVGTTRDQQRTITSMNEHAAEVMSLITAQDAKVLPLDLAQGRSTVVVSMQRDEAMVLAHDLDVPDAGSVYQTWAYDEAGNPTPAGTWMPDSSGQVAAPVTTALDDCRMLSVTVEPKGGSSQPTSPPLAMVRLA